MVSDSPRTTRRDFLEWFLATSAGALLLAVVYPIWRFVNPPRIAEPSTRRVEAGRVDDAELRERGFKIVRFATEPVILIRVSETDYRAFSATCTHLDCIVEYQKPKRRIWCNCHNGEYDLTGRNVGGPPPRPLQRFDVNVAAGARGEPGVIVISRA